MIFASTLKADDMDKRELAWRLYEDNRTFARFHENQRATSTAVIGAAAAALLATMLNDGFISNSDFPIALLLVLISLVGLALSLKSTEKLRRHNKRAKALLAIIDDEIEGVGYPTIKRNVDKQHDDENPITSRFRQSTVWVSVSYIILFASLLVSATAWFELALPL